MASPTPAAARPADGSATMRHREILEALSGLLLGMFVTQHGGVQRAAADHLRPARRRVRVHLGGHLDAARAHRDDPDLGQARRPELPNPATLPQPVRQIVQDAFGHGIGDVFLAATPFAVLALLSVLFVKEVSLQTRSALEREAERVAEVPAEV